MSALARVLEFIEPESIASDTLAFLNVKSETGAEGDGSRFLASLLEREGFAAELDFVEPGRPNIMSVVKGAGSGRTLVMNGHTDTIPIGVSTPPGRDGDWIVGRGAEDMKGGLVAMVHAASAIRKAGLRLAGDLWLTGVIGHEAPAGKKEGPLRLIERLRKGEPKADGVLIVEGPAAIWSASLGSTIFTVELTSPRGPIHTIKTRYAENPVRWLGWLLDQLASLEEEFAAEGAHPLCGREQLNIGIVAAGDYPNRLPTPARITGTWRWKPGKSRQHVENKLDALCSRIRDESGLEASYFLEAYREPFETTAAHPLVTALESAGTLVEGQAPNRIGMALVGDANLYSNLAGTPTVYYGPAHQTAHSNDERVSLERLTHCSRMYAAAAIDFCGLA